MLTKTPPAEVEIDAPLVAALLADQHPDLASLPLQLFEAGWDNVMFRLGDALVVRMPRRLVAAQLILNEQCWLPVLAPQLTLPIPAPRRFGVPGRGYPWHWSVIPWLPGAPADLHPPQGDQASIFAAFLRSLHTPAPNTAPANPVRGGPLSERAPYAEQRMERLAHLNEVITPQLRVIWQHALAAPSCSAPVWLHGDLHPRNMLVHNGQLSAIIDWGDITAGDPATDLAAIWMLFADEEARATALAAYQPDEALLRRALGWAIHLGVTLLETGLADNPRFATIGEQTLRRVCVYR
jgi:aminoglycoside phosphotransferase (APT) family kinase protein